MTVQRDYPDFSNAGDTGEDIIDSIQPVTDGEGAGQATFRRPSENLRSRTEILRTALRDLNYHRDAHDYLIRSSTTNTITWTGTVLGGGTGLLQIPEEIVITPFLTPKASTKASLSIGTVAVNQITYDVAAGAYASDGMNNVTIEHRDGGAGASLSTTISTGPVKRIVVVFDAANTAHDSAAVKASVDAAVTADTGTYGLAGKITTTDNGAASNTVDTQAETRLEGTADLEEHRITAAAIDAFTTTTPLEEGDTLAIWYRHVVEPSAGDPTDPKAGLPGGRWESNPDRGSDNVTANLFITSDDPDQIPGAIPVCKVVNDEVIFIDGTRARKDVATSFGTAGGFSFDTTNFAGTNSLVNNGGIPTTLAAPQLQTAADAVDDRLAALRAFTFVVCDGTASTGGDYEGAAALETALTALGGIGGSIYVRRGTYTFTGPLYTIPDNVTIVGEDKDLVSIGSGATTTRLGSDSRLENVTVVSTNGLALIGSRGVVVGVDADIFDCSGNNYVVKDVACVSGSNVTEFLATGSHCTFTNITTTGGVSIGGIYNSFVNLYVGDQAGYVADIPSCTISGSNHTITNLFIDTRGSAFSAGIAVARLLGDNITIDGFYTDQTAGSAVAGNGGLAIQGATNCAVRNAKITMDNGIPLLVELDGADPNDHVAFTNCQFTNDSASATDVVVSVPAGDEGSHVLSFENCVFDDSEATAHELIDMDETASTTPLTTYHSCQFYGSRLDDRIATFKSSNFYDCTFTVKNPVSGGVRILGGTNNAQTDSLWYFSDSAAERGCALHNCTFDMLDSEVNATGTGDPDIQFPLILTLSGNDSYMKDCRIINMNQHINSNGTPWGLMSSTGGTTVDGLTFYFTNTAAVQGGTASLYCLINPASGAVYRNVAFEDAAPYNLPVGAHGFGIFISQADMLFEDVNYSLEGQLIDTTVPASGLVRCKFHRCYIGSSSTGITEAQGMHLLYGTDNQYINCDIYVGSSDAAVTLDDGATYSRYLFEGTRITQIPTTATSDGFFFNGAGTATMDEWMITGCYFTTDRAAGGRAYHTGILISNVVSAGNQWVVTGGGTATAPSFAANINSY